MAILGEGITIVAQNADDIVISIAGMIFPVDVLSYAKTMDVKQHHGTGSHLPFDQTVGHIAFSGSFTVGTWITKDGDKRVLHRALMNQGDEGIPLPFVIIIMDRLPDNPQDPEDLAFNAGGAIEALENCALTNEGTDVPNGDTVQKKYDFVAMRRNPL